MYIHLCMHEPADLTDDVTEVPVMSSQGEVRLDGAEYLPDVLKAFKRFLRICGFDYVTELTAHTDMGNTHSSN